MNNVQLIGRLTRDVDLKHTAQGTAVGTFTLAVNRPFQNQQGEREADFINCVIWRKPAETLAQYTHKGSQIAVDGSIRTRNYENQQGQRVYVTEVVVNNFYFIEPRTQSEQRSGTAGFNNNTFGQSNNNNQFNNGSYNSDFGQMGNSNMFESFDNTMNFDGNDGKVNIAEDDLPF